MSALTIPDVRRCNPGAVEQAAQQLRREQSKILQVLAVLIMRRVFRMAWTGPGADAATARYGVVSDRVRGVITGLGTSAACLDTAATQLRLAVSLVARAGTVAAQEQGFVDEWGHLQMPAAAVGLDPALLALQARRESLLRADVDALVDRALVLARSADDALATALLSVANGGSSAGATGVLAAGGGVTPPPVAPGPLGAYENAAWWTSLTPVQKRQILAEHPEWVGPLDGVPAADRHTANLVLIARLEVKAQERLKDIEQVNAMGGRWSNKVALERVAELQAVRAVLARRDGGSRSLLMIDGSGQMLEAAVAVGDVDTAEHVATFIGGFTTKVGGDLARYDQTFNRMRNEAGSLNRGRLAVVTWLGYPAPQKGEIFQPGRTVVGSGLAKGYAPELARFTNGIGASRADVVHQTALAHSYGSALTGEALLQPHSFTDVAIFGSPGLPFSSVTQAGLKPGALNVLRAKSDGVAAAGPLVLGHEAETVTGSVWLSTEASKDAVNTWRPSNGHSEYLEAGTTSERNLLAIAMNRPDLKVVAGPDERAAHFSTAPPAPSTDSPITLRSLWGQWTPPTHRQLRELAVVPVH